MFHTPFLWSQRCGTALLTHGVWELFVRKVGWDYIAIKLLSLYKFIPNYPHHLDSTILCLGYLYNYIYIYT